MFTEEKPSLEDALVHFGVKGMKWGVNRSERKARETKDGVEYKRSTWDWSKDDKEDGPIKSHYSDAEIRQARKRQEVRRKAVQKATDKSVARGKDRDGYYKWTKELDNAHWNWSEQRDNYVANRKTSGEKRTAIMLAGPVGMYLTSDWRTSIRTGNQRPAKYPDAGKDRAKKVASNVAIGGLFTAAYLGGKQLGKLTVGLPR